MKPSKSFNSLAAANGLQYPTNQMATTNNLRRPQPPEPKRPPPQTNGNSSTVANVNAAAPTSPICRCRVMYLGSSVPHITKDGLQGIQEPLRELYPDKANLASPSNAIGIDSWLSVWSNGILIENIDENGREVKRFFKIEALHYCAAVKYVPTLTDSNDQSQSQQQTVTLPATSGGNSSVVLPKFLPLDSPHARMQHLNSNPPIFASILRRTTGVKVLECHAFICKREAAANALVRCCFHAYADTMYAKQIGANIENITSCSSSQIGDNNNSNHRPLGQAQTLRRGDNYNSGKYNGIINAARRSKSIAALNDETAAAAATMTGDFSDSSNNNNSNNYPSSIMRRKSINENNNNNNFGDIVVESDNSLQQVATISQENNLRKQYKLSKSMHQLNQADQQQQQIYDFSSQLGSSYSNSIHNLASSKARWGQATADLPQHDLEQQQPTFYNPYASRVPSYPPQNLIDQQQQEREQLQQNQLNNGGTLRSIKSVAANSIASTLLRSKKHAKAMAAQQQQQQQQQNQEFLNSQQRPHFAGFHQPHLSGSATLAPNQSFMMPPVPPMFMPHISTMANSNGSHTMKLPRQYNQQVVPINFETMTPKEMKKLLKKSAKYGLDPARFCFGENNANGIPLPPPLPPPPHLMVPPFGPSTMQQQQPLLLHQNNKSGGTMNSQSMYSIDGQDVIDNFNVNLLAPPNYNHFQQQANSGLDLLDLNNFSSSSLQQAPIRSVLVKPNAEFLKSKAGKKWLKQQKEFKKLLPPHLDGLPIVFGPPPLDALEPANSINDSNSNAHMAPPVFLQHQPPAPALASLPPPPPPPPLPGQRSGLPLMDANGYYSHLQQQQPMYLLPSGRASTASTQLHYSSHRQQADISNRLNHLDSSSSYDPYSSIQRSHQANVCNQRVFAHQQQQALDNNHSGQYNVGHFNGNGGGGGGGGTNGKDHHRRRLRKHMVEQSVISLGDENEDEVEDEDDGDGDESGHNHRANVDEDDDGGQTNGHYNQVSSNSFAQQQQQPHYCNNSTGDQQQNYEQVLPQPPQLPLPQTAQPQQMQTSDDQGSYSSSGIYRRGHINERAFSYSIRQEHKSSGMENGSENYATQAQHSDSQYSNQINYNQQQQQQNANIYYNQQQHQRMAAYRNGGSQYDSNNNNSNNGHHINDHLSSRLKNQLDLRQFASNPSQ